MLTIEESIGNTYYDEGSMTKTLKDAKTYNDEVTIDDVRNFSSKHIGTKRQLKGYNSFIANKPYEYYQIDIFFFEDLSKETRTKQPYGLLLVDSFSKYRSGGSDSI